MNGLISIKEAPGFLFDQKAGRKVENQVQRFAHPTVDQLVDFSGVLILFSSP